MGQSEEIKTKLDIVEIIREYTPVKAVGANFQALCPFHNEKTPSFVISPDKQIWHCFGCGRGGDVFAFVMEKEGLGFMETLRLLAPKAGVILKNERPEEHSQRNRLLDILEIAGKYYAHILSTSSGAKAKEYLGRRGLSEETIATWRIGYSLDSWDALYKFLLARPLTGPKYTDEEIFTAGLITRKENGRGYYDRFRDRIMFPIFDVHANIIAFTARVNPEKEKTEKMGKYINSPQTKVYDKSRVLFGLDKAKGAIKEKDLAIVVEGQMDAITCHQHGFKNVVASSGTALTSTQVTLLKRFSNNVALLFDMDAAGQMAADRGIKEALAQELSLKIITLPVGKDPDECLRRAPEEFARAVAEAKPMPEYYLEKIMAGRSMDRLEDSQIVANKMLELMALMYNRLEQDFWLKKLSEVTNRNEKILREDLEEAIKSARTRKTDAPRPVDNVPLVLTSREDKLTERLLALLIKSPELIGYGVANLAPEYLVENELRRFYKDLIIYYNKSTSLEYSSFRSYLSEIGRGEENMLDKFILLGEKDFYDYGVEQLKGEAAGIIGELKVYGRSHRVQLLQKAIAAAEKEGREEDAVSLMSELRNLMSAS